MINNHFVPPHLDRRSFVQSAARDLGACLLLAYGDAQSAERTIWPAQRAGTLRQVATSNTFLSQNAQLPGWAHAFGKIVDDYSGGVFNPYWGELGAMVFHGGGHAATFDNSVVVLDLNDLSFKRLSDPTLSNQGANWVSLEGKVHATDPAFDALHGEYGNGQPGAGHSYDTLAILPPQDGGARCGSLIRVASCAVHVNVSAHTGWAHRFDFTSTTMRAGSWVRWSVNGPANYLQPGACSAYDSRRKRFWWIASLSWAPPLIRYLDATTREQVELRFQSAAGRAPAADPDSATLRYEPTRDILVLTCCLDGGFVLAYLRCAEPQRGWTTATLSQPIPAVPNTALGFDWVPSLQRFIVMSDADRTALYEVSPGAPLDDVWRVARQPLGGATLPTARVTGKRWSYAESVQSFVWMAHSTSGVVAYRPVGV